MAHVISELPRLEVAQDDAERILHELDRHEFLKARGYAANFTVANVNFLVVQLVRIRVLPHLHYAAHTNVHHCDVW